MKRGGLLCMVLLGVAVLGASLTGGQRAAAAPLTAPTTTVADITDTCNHSNFFGLEPWYHFMPDELGEPEVTVNGKVVVPADPCAVRCFNLLVQDQPNECGQKASDVPGVILAIIDDLLRIAGLVAVAFIIVGAFQYVASRGNAERTAAAQSTIISALTGLAVSLIAVALVSFIGNTLS